MTGPRIGPKGHSDRHKKGVNWRQRNLAGRLRRYRDAYYLTLQQVETLIGVSYVTLWRIEHGLQVRPSTAAKVNSYLADTRLLGRHERKVVRA